MEEEDTEEQLGKKKEGRRIHRRGEEEEEDTEEQLGEKRASTQKARRWEVR